MLVAEAVLFQYLFDGPGERIRPGGATSTEDENQRRLSLHQLFEGMDAQLFRNQPEDIIGLRKAGDRPQLADALPIRPFSLHSHFGGDRRIDDSRVDFSSADHLGILKRAEAELR